MEKINKFRIQTGQQLTMLYLTLDVLLLADVFGNFIKTCTEKYTSSPLYSYTLPGYTWKGIKLTKTVLDLIKDKHLLLF